MLDAQSSNLDFPFPTLPAPAELRAVAPGIRWLRMPLPFALDHINLWALIDGEQWTQIDCGFGDAATRVLWERVLASAPDGIRPARIIATHYHPDHLGNGAWLMAKFGCPLLMPQAEFLTAHAQAGEYGGFGVAATCALFRQHGMAAEHLAALTARGNQYRRGVPELPMTYQRIIAGDSIGIGRSTWRVIPGYGHSPEHASLYCADLGVLISGDMLLPRISTNVSVWAVEPDGDPLGRFLSSLDHFAELPAETLVLPSHGLPFTGIPLRVAQLRAHHAARLGELEAAAAAPRTAADLVPILFRRSLDDQQRFFAMGEAIAHLNHLWLAGRLERSLADDGTIRFCRP